MYITRKTGAELALAIQDRAGTPQHAEATESLTYLDVDDKASSGSFSVMATPTTKPIASSDGALPLKMDGELGFVAQGWIRKSTYLYGQLR